MLKLEKILVPVDFSERSAAALKQGVALADRFHSELIFAHVIPPAPAEYEGFAGGYYVANFEPSKEETFRHFVERLEDLAPSATTNGRTQKIVLMGDPAREIVRLAKEYNADLILMPTHGYGPFRRFVLGSVTAKVLHDIDCPVLTGAHLAETLGEEPRPHHRVACAVDLRPHSEKVLRWAAEFAAAYHAGLVLVHATPPVESNPQALGFEWRRAMNQWATEQAEKLIQKVGCRAELRIDSGPPTEYIPAAVTASSADLLVIGRSEQNGLLGRLRTNAYALIRESPCPVVSI